MKNYKNCKLVVTGASAGIGKAIAKAFAEKGASVAICARNEEKLRACLDELEGGSERHFYAICDVRRKEEINDFCEEVKKKWGKIDVLVNNAGMFLPGEVHQEKDGLLEILMETNLYSAYRFSRAFADGMLENKSGHIFNISSVAGIMAYPNGGSYSITKFAMQGLTKALRDELKDHGVRVTGILPGATLTNSWAAYDGPEDRLMPAEDIAAAVISAYELSDRSVIEEMIIRPQQGDL